MSKEEMALEAWNLVKKSKEEKLSDEEHDKLYKYLIVLMGDDSLYSLAGGNANGRVQR